MANPTGFSAPPSEHDVSILNISSSSGSTVLLPAPTKKHRFTPAERAASSPQGELQRVNAHPAVPALVATSQNVQLHNATQIHVSSGSEISVASSMERQRRFDLARAKRELAELRVREANELARAERELAEARVADAQSRLDQPARSGVSTTLRAKVELLREHAVQPTWVHVHRKVVCPTQRTRRKLQTPFYLLYTNVVERLHTTEATTDLAGVFSSARRVPSETDLAGLHGEPQTTTNCIQSTHASACPPQDGLPHGSASSPKGDLPQITTCVW
jgi:hypothetical protein